jgi:large subunit ribosomal protein L15e
MGFYKYIKALWKNPRAELHDEYKAKLVDWKKEPVTLRIEFPTRIDRARALGYKAKQGYLLVRQRVTRGGHIGPKKAGGRRSKNFSQKIDVNLNYQTVAERRANDSYPNCEVLNSYWVGKDGTYDWYEVILVDRNHPVIKADLPFMQNQRGRAYRGKTSAQRKSRGLRNKGKGAEKVRPSLRANDGKLH